MESCRVKYYKRNFLLLCFDSVLFSFTLSIFSTVTVLPHFVGTITDNKFFVGLIPAIMIIGTNVTQVFSSVWSVNCRNKKHMLLLSSLGQRFGLVLITVSAGLVNRLPGSAALAVFFAAFAIFAIMNGCLQPVWTAVVAGSIYENRGKFFGLFNMLGGILGVLGSFVTTMVLDRVPYPTGYVVIFCIGVAAAILSVFLVLCVKYDPAEEERAIEPLSLKKAAKQLPSILREDTGFRNFLIGRMLIAMGELSTSFFIGRYLFHFSRGESEVGIINMVLLVAQSLFAIIWGIVGDRKGYRVILRWVCLFGLVADCVALWAGSAPLFYLAFMLVGANYNGLTISTSNSSIQYAPPKLVPIYMTITNLVLVPFTGFGVMIVGSLANLLTDSIIFVLSAAGFLAGWLVLTFTKEKTMERAC